jgi:isopentenyldiphosphate isomerase
MTEEKVVLVNEQDEVIGTDEKTRAHLIGALHQALKTMGCETQRKAVWGDIDR